MSQVRRRSLIPQPVRGEVPRDHLLSTDAQILLLTAPSGYGKTVLSAQVARQTPNVPIWIRVTRDAAEPDVLADLMAQALRAAGYGTPEHEVARTTQPGPSALTAALLADLTSVPEDLLLILDNAEHLSASSAGVLTAVLEQLPPWHRALVNTTPGGHLDLIRLVASGQAYDVDTETLRFSVHDTQVYLENIGSPRTADAHALHEQTDGWPAALALASTRERAETSMAMVEHLLGRMPQALRDLVVRAAVETVWDAHTPERVGLAPVADWLRDVTRIGFPVTQEEAGVRPHALVTEALNRVLARDGALHATQHRAAAQRAADASNWYRALHHALTAQDYPFARELVRAHLLHTWKRQSNWELLTQTLEQFPRDQLSPDLLAFLGLAYGETGRVPLAQEIFAAQLSAGQETAVTFLGLMFASYRSQDFATMKTMAERGLQVAQTPYEQSQLLRGLATYHLIQSQMSEARELAGQAVTVARAAADHSLEISARTVEFWCLTHLPETTDQAVDLGLALLNDALALGFVNKGLVIVEALIGAMVDAGRLDETARVVALVQHHMTGYTFMGNRFAQTRGNLAQMRGNVAEALEWYEEGARKTQQNPEDRYWVATLSHHYLAAIAAGSERQLDDALDDALTTEPENSRTGYWLGAALTARHLIRQEPAAALALADEYTSKRDKEFPSMSWDYVVQDYLRVEAKRAAGQDISGDLTALLQDRLPRGTATILRLVPPQLWGAAFEAIRRGIHADVFTWMTQRAPGSAARPTVTVQTLGQWTVTLNGVPVKLPHLAVELLVYLSLHGPTSIQQLGAILAPRSRDARGRIHRAKADLQRLTGHVLIDTDAVMQRGLYRLSDQIDFQLDVLALLDVKDAQAAQALMRGPFLPGADDEGWVGAIRERLAVRVAGLYAVHAEQVRQTASAEALAWFWQAASLTPWNSTLWTSILALGQELGAAADVADAHTALQELEHGNLPTALLRSRPA